jgi:hypothetical protein
LPIREDDIVVPGEKESQEPAAASTEIEPEKEKEK